MDRTRVATIAWLVPACNFGAGIEWQAGVARGHESGRSMLAETYAQAKMVFPGADDSPWNVGLVAGVIRRPGDPRHNGWDNPYVLAPISFAPPDTGNAFHANIGWRHDRGDRRHLTLWGVAAEIGAGERFTLLGEAFGENSGRPFLRLGARYAAIKDRLDIDLSVVTRPGGTREERLVSLGVTWLSGRLPP